MRTLLYITYIAITIRLAVFFVKSEEFKSFSHHCGTIIQVLDILSIDKNVL